MQRGFEYVNSVNARCAPLNGILTRVIGGFNISTSRSRKAVLTASTRPSDLICKRWIFLNETAVGEQRRGEELSPRHSDSATRRAVALARVTLRRILCTRVPVELSFLQRTRFPCGAAAASDDRWDYNGSKIGTQIGPALWAPYSIRMSGAPMHLRAHCGGHRSPLRLRLSRTPSGARKFVHIIARFSNGTWEHIWDTFFVPKTLSKMLQSVDKSNSSARI